MQPGGVLCRGSAASPPAAFPRRAFSGMGDPNLLRYTEDTIYENLVATLDSDEYFVENVSAVYISQEYIDELAYNSQANIYFGYTLQELAEQFQGTKYIFTLGDDGSTIVTEFEEYDDTYDRALKNVAIGTGVILVCVTVSLVSAGAGRSRRQHDLLRSRPKAGPRWPCPAASWAGVAAGIVTGVQTGDMGGGAQSRGAGWQRRASNGARSRAPSAAARARRSPSRARSRERADPETRLAIIQRAIKVSAGRHQRIRQHR